MTPSRRPPLARLGPTLVVAAAVAANVAGLLPTLTPAAYLDDASVHEQMVRYATESFRAGHDPLLGWFPYLGLGSPQFLHYQSLGAMVTGAVGLVTGPDVAFRWSLLLLWGLWPLSVWASARLLRLGPWAAAAAAVLAPTLSSVPAVGYERGAYLWVGYGLWSQLWGSWLLPLAWGTSWRAVGDRRWLAPAVAAIGLTVAFHFETGYLALLAPMIWPWLVPSDLKGRLARAAGVLGLGLAASAWVVVPLVRFGPWASINEYLRDTPLSRGYGARVVLGWLVSGRVLDDGRFPVVTLLAAAGVTAAALRWRARRRGGSWAPSWMRGGAWLEGRALVAVGVASLVLSFGRTTFGPLADVVPGSHDVFFRRFMAGAQLAGVLLAGAGAAAAVTAAGALARRGAAGVGVRRAAGRARPGGRARPAPARAAGALASAATVALVVAAVVPAAAQVRSYDALNGDHIEAQHRAEAGAGRLLAAIVARIRSRGGGRTYAGSPQNWGQTFTVGAVPVFKYLEGEDVDEVGYTLRTASLMTDPEAELDPSQAGQLELFGIRWVIEPAAMSGPPGGRPVLTSGPYRLWLVAAARYLQVLDTVGVLRADRADVAARSAGLLASPLPGDHEDLSVAWAGAPAAAPTGGPGEPGPPGTVLSQHADLVRGEAGGLVRLRRPAVVVLSASYDPGWRASVDGRRAPTQMLAPALVGVAVPAGVHRVRFTYVGWGAYPYLWGTSGLAMATAIVLGRRRRRSVRWPARCPTIPSATRPVPPPSGWGSARSASRSPT